MRADNGIHRTGVRHDRSAGFTSAGSNHNYPVGSPGTVDRCCRSIFQDIDTFDILRIQAGNRISDQVDIVITVDFRSR